MKKMLIALSILLATNYLSADNEMQMQNSAPASATAPAPAPAPTPTPAPAPQMAPQSNQMPATDEKMSKEYTMQLKDTKQQAPRQIRLQLELSESDVKDYGLPQSMLSSELSTRLALAQIQIKDDPALPRLVLRVKSIQADRAIATFVQLGFFEDAVLTRNKSTISALTWSQATLISGPKEEMVKEVTQIIISMVNSFILDYNKAMSA